MTTTEEYFPESIIKQALDGDETSFTLIVTKYRDRIINGLLKKGISPNDTGDAVQIAFIELWKKREKILPTNIFWWLCMTAFHRALDIQKKTKRFQLVWDAWLFDTIFTNLELTSLDDFSTREDLIPNLKIALQRISKNHRTVLVQQMEGNSYKSIAKLLGCKIGTVMSQRSRATESLRKEFLKIYKT